ncbi:hypothetical protein [Streptomyces sp. 6N106]|uniref:hypothetical protein n=1 Tax=Streptomyces sp. 6N106 TaxID=3457418 RepID=UPI003FCF7973
MTLPGYGKSIGALADQAESLDNIDPDNGEATGGEAGRLDEWAPKWLHEQIRPRITATLKTIHDKAPNAKILSWAVPGFWRTTAHASSAWRALRGNGSTSSPTR